MTGKFASVLPVTIASLLESTAMPPAEFVFPPNSDEYKSPDASGFNFVTNTAFFAPFVADRCDPETTGKSEEVVKPVTYMLPCESRAIPAMLSLPAPPR